MTIYIVILRWMSSDYLYYYIKMVLLFPLLKIKFPAAAPVRLLSTGLKYYVVQETLRGLARLLGRPHGVTTAVRSFPAWDDPFPAASQTGELENCRTDGRQSKQPSSSSQPDRETRFKRAGLHHLLWEQPGSRS